MKGDLSPEDSETEINNNKKYVIFLSIKVIGLQVDKNFRGLLES